MPTRDEVTGLMQDDEFGRLPSLVALGEAAVPVLADILSDPAVEPILRQRAAVALREIGSATAIPELTASLNHPDPVQRILAARALAGIAGAGAAEPIMELLVDADPSVAKVAVQMLAQVDDGRALPALTQAAERGASDFVRAEARAAIDEIRSRIA
jgi:HEAT repeat protein